MLEIPLDELKLRKQEDVGWHKTKDREEAYRNAINIWLKANPDNQVVCKQVIEQNKFRRNESYNVYGGTRDNPKDLRIGISLPPGLYYTLLNLEKFHGNEFMKDKQDLHWFARKFPQFTIMQRI
jgi:hypothetical protein